MNITQLYEQTPPELQGNIRVTGEKVFFRDNDGSSHEYLLTGDGELWLIRSDRELRQALQEIKTKLGI